MLLPLDETIKHNPVANILKLSPAENMAFVTMKDILAKVSVLTYPDLNAAQYHLVADRLSFVVGATLPQIINGDSVPIGFYLKKEFENQRKYFTFD